VVRTIARSRPRDIFGELKTEEFYVSDKRDEKSERVKAGLNELLNPYGVIVERVSTKDYRFNPAYQKAIEDKKVAEQNKSATKAAQEEYLKKLEDAKGEVNKMVAEARGITEMNKALVGSGGEVMVKLKLAEALEGKRILLLPLSGAGMDIKTTNINQLLETYGIKSLTSGGGARPVDQR
jgi:regulator of protease activity HflC (stomatin/prohibitin superfamily)